MFFKYQKPLRFGRSNRGQLQIAETIVSVMIIIVLMVLLISSTLMIVSIKTNNSWMRSQALESLSAADESGLLRPAIYFGEEDPTLIQSLEEYLYAFISLTADYSLAKTNMSSDSSTAFFICGMPAAPSSPVESFTVTYFLGSFSSNEYGTINYSFVVQMIIWRRL